MTYAQLKKSNIFYLFLNLLIYFSALYFSNILITKGILFITLVSFSVYYFSDLLNIEKANKNSIFFTGVFINFCLFTVMTLKVGLKDVEKASLIYLPMVFLHVVLRKLFFKITKERGKLLIIGNNYKNNLVEHSIKKSKNYINEGFVSNKEIVNNKDKLYIGKIEEIKRIVLSRNITEIVITTENEFDENILKELLNLKLMGIKIYKFSDFYEKNEEKIDVKSITEVSILYGEGFELFHNFYMQKIKRIIDVLMAFMVLIITFPIILLSILIIKIESRGPVFFIQERIGKGNKPFKIIKFRSMKIDAEKDGPKWAGKNDNRVTFYGKIMRKTRIDELPQLINVLKGEMSFIGPRPERQYFIEMLEKEIPFYNLRHSVLPGLTGWAQVNYNYGASVEDAFEKLQYDLYYIKYQSLIMDIIIVFKTLKVILGWKGR